LKKELSHTDHANILEKIKTKIKRIFYYAFEKLHPLRKNP
jgi:hypothetical protein